MIRAATTFLSASIFGLCVVLRQTLEADPVTHVLVQLPLLATSGALLASAWPWRPLRLREAHANAVVLLAVVAILFWMLPRNIDAALGRPAVEMAKLVSIPTFVGGFLAVAWPRASPYLRGFLKANALSMLGVLAFLYTHAPVRICNAYLVSDQERLGYGFLLTALGLAVAWSLPLFWPPARHPRSPGPLNGKAMS